MAGSKHSEYWYFILPSTTTPKSSWINIAQEDDISSVRYSLDGAQYIIKALKANVSPQMAAFLGASTYHQCMQHIKYFDPENWIEPPADGLEGDPPVIEEKRK